MPLEGGAELQAVALRLREAGQAGLIRAMYKNIRLAAAPAAERVRESARSTLPHGGGLNDYIADSTIRTSVRVTAKTASVTMRLPKHRRAIDQGIVRHPVHGHRDKWATTKVRPGFWTEPLQGMKPEILAGAHAAMREAALMAGFR